MAHGFGGQRAHNRPYAEVFAQNGIAAYIFDFIGGGNNAQSDGTTAEMSVLTEAADMAVVLDGLAAMDKVDSESIFLASQSQGGFVASYIAGTQPEKARDWWPSSRRMCCRTMPENAWRADRGNHGPAAGLHLRRGCHVL